MTDPRAVRERCNEKLRLDFGAQADVVTAETTQRYWRAAVEEIEAELESAKKTEDGWAGARTKSR